MWQFLRGGTARFSQPAKGPTDAVHPGWPEATPAVRVPCGMEVRLRPLLRSDGREWSRLRLKDEEHLRPVEPTLDQDWVLAHSPTQWRSFYSALKSAAAEGTAVPMAILVDGQFAGQVTVGSIQHGAASDCWIGYWVDSDLWGRGIATAACALGTDHCFDRVGLHRVTATFLPDNPASGAVLAHCGFFQEGLLRGNLHIDGRWQDHFLMAQLSSVHSGRCVAGLRRQGRVL